MNTKAIDVIANAVLYEGYMLYPYRPSSVKNRQRFNFGVLYPRSYSRAQSGSDAWSAQAECLVQTSSPIEPGVEVKVRFLKLVTRATAEGTSEGSTKAAVSWQEAIECDVAVSHCNLEKLASAPSIWPFSFAAKTSDEVVRDASGNRVGEIVRTQEFVQGKIEISAERKARDLFKLSVRVDNLTEFDGSGEMRDQALARSLVSAHILLGAAGGQFVSLLDPPENLKEVVESCHNIGIWPVLVGAEGERDTMLASPIILYDYPQIAPESQGDFFDGAEIDEILALRILTMTDAEKHEMRHGDERARKMLERTESLPMEHLMKLHGTLRELRPLKEETP
jgi:hydrogenase maturation protease